MNMLRQMCGVLVLENKCFAIASCQSIVAKPNCFGFSSIIFEAKNETKDKKNVVEMKFIELLI